MEKKIKKSNALMYITKTILNNLKAREKDLIVGLTYTDESCESPVTVLQLIFESKVIILYPCHAQEICNR